MGSVMDAYFHFSEPGDHYLGRVLSGLDPNVSYFKVLPPHWKISSNILQNKFIKSSMQLMYGQILRTLTKTIVDPYSVLLYCLSSIVYH